MSSGTPQRIKELEALALLERLKRNKICQVVDDMGPKHSGTMAESAQLTTYSQDQMDVHHAGNFLLVQQLHESNNFLQKTYHWLAPSQPHKNLGNNRRDLILLTWIKL